jgi:hypothetical protein
LEEVPGRRGGGGARGVEVVVASGREDWMEVVPVLAGLVVETTFHVVEFVGVD